MPISSLSSLSGGRHAIYNFYQEAVRTAQLANDVTYSTNTTLTNWVAAKTLTINAGVTLTMLASGAVSFIFADLLVLNGTIKTDINPDSEIYVAGYRNGGGAGNVFIFARQITGTGAINANGNSATGSTAFISGTGNGTTTIWNVSGQYLLSGSIMGGFAPSSGISTGGSAGIKAVTVTNMTLPFSFINWVPTIPDNYKILSGCGNTGSYAGSSGGYYAPGGGGGASIVSNGGAGASSPSNPGGYGGPGGGGGGYVYIVTQNNIPAITINANGGNGANGGTLAGGGGGGGGGLVSILAPSTSATVTVSGGNAGTGGSIAAQAGGTGLSLFTKVNFS